MKKFFALLLVVLMLLPSIIACGKDKDDDTTPSTQPPATTAPSTVPSSGNGGNADNSQPGTTPSTGSGTGSSDVPGSSTSSTVPSTPPSSTTPSTTPGGDTPDDPIIENPPVTVNKWSGQTLNILATVWGESSEPGAPWSQVELVAKSATDTTGFGQTINAAVLRRAEFIKSEYGVDLNWINARSSQISGILTTSKVGQGTKYHIAMPRMLEGQTIVQADNVYNLAGRDYIDLTKSYYNQAALESYTIYGNTLFVAGDFSFLDEQTSYLVYYNVAMVEGKEIPDLHQMVIDGRWTIDEMTNVAKLVTKNSGDPMWTDDDEYGFGTTNLARFFQYSGIQQVSVKSTAYGNQYVLSLNDDKVGTLIDKLLTIEASDWARTKWDGDYGALQAAFVEGRLLFYNEVVQKTDYFTNQTNDFKVGILPCPKLSVEQDTYYTPCSYQSVIMCIPKSTPNREMSDYFFEILSYTGQKYVMEAYKQNLRGKLNPDTADESMDVVENYIFSNLCYDQGYMYGWTGLLSHVQSECFASGTNNFTSVYTSASEDAAGTISDWNEYWLDYSDE